MGKEIDTVSLFAKYIVSNNHSGSDYFALIKELVALRNRQPAAGSEYVSYQAEIDRAYSLVEQEIRENAGLPVTPVKFGTSGWRGILGKDIFVKSVGQVTLAIVEMYRDLESGSELAALLGVEDFQEARQRGCVVCFDNRFGGEILAGQVVDVLTSNGIVVHYAGEATTGTLSASVLELKAAFSINLTPSHNPLEYGGFKFNAADAGPAAAVITNQIMENVGQIMANDRLPDRRPDPSLIRKHDALAAWTSLVRANIGQHGLDYDGIIDAFARADNLVVAVDCVHGASRIHVRPFFKEVQSDRLLVLRGNPDPTFGGIAPEPSSKNMEPVVKALRARNEPLKLGVVIDPDGDRIRFTDGTNEINMNKFGVLAYHYLHEIKKKKGLVAKTVATSNFANAVAEALHEEVFEPRVGFKEFKPVIGRALVLFEESDGISIIGHTPEKDAYIGLLLALDMVLSQQKNLGEYLREIEEIYGKYCPGVSSVSVSRQGEELQETLGALERYGVGSELEIAGTKRRIVKVIDIDGRKMIFDNNSWILIRPSGTEPKVRFYVEARSEAEEGALLETARQMLVEAGLL